MREDDLLAILFLIIFMSGIVPGSLVLPIEPYPIEGYTSYSVPFGGGRAQHIHYFLQSVPTLCLMLANALKEDDETMKSPHFCPCISGLPINFRIVLSSSGYPMPYDYVRGVKLLRL